MNNRQLKNIDLEDIEDLLLKVETSFGIQFQGNELVHIVSFGELCDYIADKIQLNNFSDCTSQQAFYKLRNAISQTLRLDSRTITTDLPLGGFLPKRGRRSKIKEIESYLGFKLNLLAPPNWVTGILVSMLLVFFVGVFFSWKIGLLGFMLSAFGLWIVSKKGTRLKVKTVRDVVEVMVKESYLKSRRIKGTFNKSEIEQVLIHLFSSELGIDSRNLRRESMLR